MRWRLFSSAARHANRADRLAASAWPLSCGCRASASSANVDGLLCARGKSRERRTIDVGRASCVRSAPMIQIIVLCERGIMITHCRCLDADRQTFHYCAEEFALFSGPSSPLARLSQRAEARLRLHSHYHHSHAKQRATTRPDYKSPIRSRLSGARASRSAVDSFIPWPCSR